MDNRELGLETRIKINEVDCTKQWYPVLVDDIRNGLVLDRNIEGADLLYKNLSYSIQYLEFCDKLFDEMILTHVFNAMLTKTYIITGCGILEGIFINILKSNNWWIDNGDNREMSIWNMITILETHSEELGINQEVFSQIRETRNLRNYVHLQAGRDEFDHDYNTFSEETRIKMKKALYAVLSCREVTNEEYLDNYRFLLLNRDEE